MWVKLPAHDMFLVFSRLVKITSLDLAISKDNGLKPGVMSPLGRLVILAGPNGAGKSRILQTVNRILSNTDVHAPRLQTFQRALSRGGPAKERQTTRWQKTVEMSRNFVIDGEYAPNSVLDFFPKAYGLVDYRTLNEADQHVATEAVKGLGIAGLERNALAYVASVERRWFSATHQGLSIPPEVVKKAVEQRHELAALIREFLGVAPEMDVDQQPTLFGLPMPEAQLSQGQSILLQVAVALHAQGSKLGGLVLILDEPECHLHPAAIVEAINRLLSLNALGQVWIATHCVPVLAAMPPESIWYVNEGGVSWAGRRPEIVIEGLLGGPAGRERMEEFLRLPAQFASNRFASECLIPPKVVNTGSDDPQARQLREFCQVESRSASRPLRVMDFGAGQGRLLSALHERWELGTFTEAIDYLAFEPFADTSSQLRQSIEVVYAQDNTSRVFSRRDELAMVDFNTVDIMVMCNVLHEVPPEEWRHLFGAEGSVFKLLRPDGHLLVLEDMEIPHGEKAHRFGFLLLDTPHLYRLMKCSEDDTDKIRTVSALANRLKAHAIPARLLGRTDRDSTVSALALLKETAREKVVQLRKQEASSRSGRLHALWTQLLANADLGLQAL